LVPTSKTTKTDGDATAIYLADEMAHAHNAMIRQLNSMYLQAPYVTLEADQSDLCQYAVFWKDFLHHHHHLEEEQFFPDIERITGAKGIMDHNVEEHAAFLPALDTFGQYAKDCLNKAKKFDSKEFIRLIDAFAPTLSTHLKGEIDTLLVLGKYNVGPELRKAYLVLAGDAQKASKTEVFPLVCGGIDNTYEGGASWPGFPVFVPYMVDYLFARKYRSVWRFNPCTIYGKPRPLPFLPKHN